MLSFVLGVTPSLLLSSTHPVSLRTHLRRHLLCKEPEHFPVAGYTEAAGAETQPGAEHLFESLLCMTSGKLLNFSVLDCSHL